MELAAIKMWEFTDEVKQDIWKDCEWDDEIREGYKNNHCCPLKIAKRSLK